MSTHGEGAGLRAAIEHGSFRVVGVGPGDPELITLKAARLIAGADVVAYHQGVGKSSNARRIAADLLPAGVVEEVLEYPVTTGLTDHPGGYDGAMTDFYDDCERRTRAHLEQGRDVVLLAEGDPLFYGSAMYLHDRLSAAFDTAVVPGIPAFAAATAAAGAPLVRHTDVLTVLPGTLPVPELARRLADTDGAIIMKLGRRFPGVRDALEQAGRLEGALYVERASMVEQRYLPVADVDPATVPYFSLIIVPGDTKPRALTRDDEGGASKGAPHPQEVLVIGLGPGPDGWLTPEASAALAEVGHVIGYAPYVDRVPQRAGLQRHSSGNTVEVDRARHALDLALAGEKVAVVSGGDAGVFGMASAVFEAAESPEYAAVAVRVLPGVSAVQAVAARAGAPVGADFAVVSLSDRLKPWEVVEKRVRAIAEADLVMAVYNPRSRSRTTQVADLRKILLEHRAPETVVVVGRDVGRAEESLAVTTLADLDPESIDMKCLLIVGASSTRVTPSGRVWTPRFVT
ncbi:precorrin-3B C(17)-methyltransferase [Aeromicrobium alkaliterrae]|uniref:Precorrin-2 C(20)-methyltransferase n=1 Tax=Aeromicrobium alkaliterrae TaxID=302168 RepID=A0ABN2JXQ7_9ACTN